MMFSKKSVCTYAFTLLLAGSVAMPALANPTVVSAPSIRIDNFGKVDSNYYRGAQPKGRDFADLAKLGVKLVIDLAAEGDRQEGANVQQAGMKFVRIPLGAGDPPSQAELNQFMKLVDDPANQPVYVHCMGGKHRTGALTAVYRMTHEGWTADRAFAEMKQYKFGADFMHPALKSFVYNFYGHLDKSQTPVLATAIPAVK
jgi:tyrosine-protein phosphatase SIW14